MQTSNSLRQALKLQRAVLEDKISLLSSLSQSQYVAQNSSIGGASVGQHIRHSLFHTTVALDLLGNVNTNPTSNPTGDYDTRPRSDLIETSLPSALNHCRSLLSTLSSYLTSPPLSIPSTSPCTVSFLTSPSTSTSFPSTVSREIQFAAHHTTHHLASINTALNSSGLKTPKNLGKALSTKTHDRVKFIYHSAWFCPFAHRATIALSHHSESVDYTWVESLGWEQRDNDDDKTGTGKEWWYHWKNPDLLRVNEAGMVPTLVEDLGGGVEGRVVTESLICTDFIDNVVREREGEDIEGRYLLPHGDPYEMARCRVWSDKVAKELCSPYYSLLVKKEREERVEAYENIKAGIARFSRELERTGGKLFLEDDQLSVVDIALFPWAWRYYVFKHYRGEEFDVSRDSMPTDEHRPFFDWLEHVTELPKVKKTLPDKDRYLVHIGKYADGSARSKVAEAVRRGVAAHEYDDEIDKH
ncbi:hypothetical protein TrST_g12489 [Triparma strigata]|uniref:Glutathione S-transferase n=1 Tax=Triparma strigata TaxID=1606541 RepID=A0A9W7B145_9STRA|nr:hypothetical protein TrST_g12489 [Triparma strigata]